MAFLRAESFAELWRHGQPGLWVLEDRLEGKRATLRHPAEHGFAEALLARLKE